MPLEQTSARMSVPGPERTSGMTAVMSDFRGKPEAAYFRTITVRPPARGEELPRACHPLIFAGARRRDRHAAVGIFVQLVAQRADGDAEDVGGVRPVAEAMLQRLKDQVALHIRNRAPDQRPRHLLGGE